MAVEQLLHEHLVPALEDRLGIVHDRHAERVRLAQKLVDDALGARTVEKAVELGQALHCVRGDELRLQSYEWRRLQQSLQRFLIRGLVRFVGIPEDRESWPTAFRALPLGD